jgi:hypothetical protein
MTVKAVNSHESFFGGGAANLCARACMLTDVMQLHQLDARCGQACNITQPRVQDFHVIRLRDDTGERVVDKLRSDVYYQCIEFATPK